jgi:DNA-binding MarR family transcriptional regulator
MRQQQEEAMDDPVPEDVHERRVAAIRALVGLTRSFESACLECGLSLPQYRLLASLQERPGRAGEIADRMGVSRSSLTDLAAALERSGLVARSQVEGDRRGVALALTAEGDRALGRAERRIGAAIRGLAGLGAALEAPERAEQE